MQEFVIKETTVWGDTYNKRSMEVWKRCFEKSKLRNWYPYVDHAKIFACKLPGQKGPAREKQTFIVSFAYASGVDGQTTEQEEAFFSQVHNAGLYTSNVQGKTHKSPTAKRLA